MIKMVDRDPLLRDEEDMAFADAVRAREAENEPPTPAPKGDLVLRMTLLKKGVITEAELEDTEKWLTRAQEEGRVLMLEADEGGELQWRLLTLEDLRKALGNVVVPS